MVTEFSRSNPFYGDSSGQCPVIYNTNHSKLTLAGTYKQLETNSSRHANHGHYLIYIAQYISCLILDKS